MQNVVDLILFVLILSIIVGVGESGGGASGGDVSVGGGVVEGVDVVFGSDTDKSQCAISGESGGVVGGFGGEGVGTGVVGVGAGGDLDSIGVGVGGDDGSKGFGSIGIGIGIASGDMGAISVHGDDVNGRVVVDVVSVGGGVNVVSGGVAGVVGGVGVGFKSAVEGDGDEGGGVAAAAGVGGGGPYSYIDVVGGDGGVGEVGEEFVGDGVIRESFDRAVGATAKSSWG
ncbi:hypothetical protein AGMMS49936_03570 [Endomicrobiia bacterium]|nr:hypothetical protein AGMMS49936_03570 [Endomicrobiia bacterium]